MIYRNIRVRATGQWVNALFAWEKADPQNTSAESHIASIATSLGVAPSSLEAVDSATDQRTGTLLQLPPPAAEAPDPDLAAFLAGDVPTKFRIVARRAGIRGVT